MRPFKFVYRVDSYEPLDRDKRIEQLRGFVRKLEKDGFGVSGREPRVFYDGGDEYYDIYDKGGRHFTGGCEFLYRDGLLGVFNRPGNRLLTSN